MWILVELQRPKGPPSGAPYSSWERKGNPWVDFLMVIMARGIAHASGIARGRIRTTMATMTAELPNMAAILQKRDSLSSLNTSLILDIHTIINWHLSKQGIRWPVSHDHIAGSRLQLIEVACVCEVDRWPSAGFPIRSQAHARLTCWKTGQGCSLAGLRI